MEQNYSLPQFVKDGFMGVAGVLVISIATLTCLFLINRPDNIESLFEQIGWLFFFKDSTVSPMPFVMLLGFINLGIGGRFLENIPTRWGWLKPILLISIISWVTGIGMFLIILGDAWGWDWEFIRVLSAFSGVGFFIAGLLGIIFNPAGRLYKFIIGTMAGIGAGYAFGIVLLVTQIMQ